MNIYTDVIDRASLSSVRHLQIESKLDLDDFHNKTIYNGIGTFLLSMDERPQPRIDSVVSESLALIQGKWKVAILYILATKSEQRFNEMMKELEGISPKILAKQLKDMEADGFIIRMIFSSNPPVVLYSLSYKGASLIPILQSLEEWGLKYLNPSNSGSGVQKN